MLSLVICVNSVRIESLRTHDTHVKRGKSMTENQNTTKTEEMNNNIKNEMRQRNAVLINQETKRQIQEWLEGNPYQELLNYMSSRVMGGKQKLTEHSKSSVSFCFPAP